jgi:hypothetical protein
MRFPQAAACRVGKIAVSGHCSDALAEKAILPTLRRRAKIAY